MSEHLALACPLVELAFMRCDYVMFRCLIQASALLAKRSVQTSDYAHSR